LTDFRAQASFSSVDVVSGFFADLVGATDGTIFGGCSGPAIFEIHISFLEFTDTDSLVSSKNEFLGFHPFFVGVTHDIIRWANSVNFLCWHTLLSTNLSFELLSTSTRSRDIALLLAQRTADTWSTFNFDFL
jgi:hypothetical protein